MMPTLERDQEQRVAAIRGRRSYRTEEHGKWARACATVGAAVWAALTVLARLGVIRVGAIELLFLFAPLVIVPLGLELCCLLSEESRLADMGRRLQPAGAVLAVLAICLPPGRLAGTLSLGWMAACTLIAGAGLLDLVHASWRDTEGAVRATVAVARIDLAVGGAWLLASRLGMRPMGIQEPIGLLTAVHFHFAGFATAAIAAATLRFGARSGAERWLKPLVFTVTILPYLVAAGFVISPVLKMTAAILFSATVAALAVGLRNFGKNAQDPTARILLQVAAGAVFAGMVLAGMYAVADYLGSTALSIPQMARTHGVLNAVGFCLPGLLGWLVENSKET